MATVYDVGVDSEEEILASFIDEIPGQLAPISLQIPESENTQDIDAQNHEFRIRLANTQERRESASILINKMYSWRGYGNSSLIEDEPNRITLIASDNDKEVIGTISVGLDSPSLGLFADDMYHEELEELRGQGRKLCEYNRLAMDPRIKNKRVLASLFHIAFLYPWGIFGCTDGVLEVNPRHVRFYERLLGFKQIGPERVCPRVNAPSILLRSDFAYASDQIKKLGGLMHLAEGEKSLYPYFFNTADADGILGRLKVMA